MGARQQIANFWLVKAHTPFSVSKGECYRWWAMQVDGFFFVCSILKNHFAALGIVVAEKYYSPGGAVHVETVETVDTRTTRPSGPSGPSGPSYGRHLSVSPHGFHLMRGRDFFAADFRDSSVRDETSRRRGSG
jgi:hypothetical protein